jgi:hypothetical protein
LLVIKKRPGHVVSGLIKSNETRNSRRMPKGPELVMYTNIMPKQ